MPNESVAVFLPEPVPPTLIVGLTLVPAPEAVGESVGAFDWAVPIEPVELFPPPICIAAIELSAVLPPPRIPLDPPVPPEGPAAVDPAEPLGGPEPRAP